MDKPIPEGVAAEFAVWLAKEMPPGTYISSPQWWASRIIRQIEFLTAAQQQGKAVAEVVQEADGVNLRFVGPILPAGTRLYTAPPPSAADGEVRGLTRYFPSKPNHPGWEMTPDINGDWVLFEDISHGPATVEKYEPVGLDSGAPIRWIVHCDNHSIVVGDEATAKWLATRLNVSALAQQPASDGGFTAADMMDARQEGRKEAQQPAASHCSDERPCVPCFSDCGPCEDVPAAVDGALVMVQKHDALILADFAKTHGGAMEQLAARRIASIATQHQEPKS